jgi:hypothetical protein
MSEMVTYAKPQTAAEINDQQQLVQRVMADNMKLEVHYGVIPGTDKPTLFKPGAEKLLSTFHISVRPEIVDLSTDDCITYRVMAHGVHMGSNVIVGVGVGECSTNEEKYKWRSAMPKEWAATAEARRRIKYGWTWGPNRGEKIETEALQVRTNPADLANTALKMAKKRAEVDLCLTALAVSDMFTQDLEDVNEETGEVIKRTPPKYGSTPPAKRAPVSGANPAHDGNGIATEKQIGLVRVKLDQANLDPETFCRAFEIQAMTDLKFAQVNPALDWIRQGGRS